ncbi:hypothetical protein K438DRAFT_2159636 [Mycena galopus ATCC 62051]|nr:hypothetical protein K438DRAFT_2159636 [Mycena galopus ATCC 62051]
MKGEADSVLGNWKDWVGGGGREEKSNMSNSVGSLFGTCERVCEIFSLTVDVNTTTHLRPRDLGARHRLKVKRGARTTACEANATASAGASYPLSCVSAQSPAKQSTVNRVQRKWAQVPSTGLSGRRRLSQIKQSKLALGDPFQQECPGLGVSYIISPCFFASRSRRPKAAVTVTRNAYATLRMSVQTTNPMNLASPSLMIELDNSKIQKARKHHEPKIHQPVACCEQIYATIPRIMGSLQEMRAMKTLDSSVICV